ncbi:MAG: NAD-dependent succinate-semialdehyde dehydrogenase [Sphingomonadales bacterium]|nr:NAD-dependent succinate-semialdehyde dehydrogenase [Sphingomonadales bacterium]
MTDSAYPDLALVIDGERIGAAARDGIDVVDPATGDTLGVLPKATRADLDRALDTAQRRHRDWRATPLDTRVAILKKAAALIRERAKDIGRIATREQGKPLKEAIGETLYAASLFEWMAEESRRTYGRVLVRPPGQLARVTYEAVGPVAAFAPWNFPTLNVARKLAPALAAGNAIILKPAEETPGSALAILQALIDAGLPDGTAQVVFGDPAEISSHLLASPIIRKLSFTGSVPVGKHLMKLAADHAIRTTMELGGHAPVLIFDDADIDRTLDIIAPNAFRNAGQVCVSPTRFYVQSGVYDSFVKAFGTRVAAMTVGNGLDDATTMGPLANPRRPDAVGRLVDDAKAKGARVVSGGTRIDGAGLFFQPTVLADVPVEADIMNDEPFGPVALFRPFDTADDAIEQANRLPFGLASYVFTENGRQANRVADLIEAGMVAVNHGSVSAIDAPFGGIKDSGHGLEDGAEGLKAFMVSKTVHQA